jgi:hypothetical protein
MARGKLQSRLLKKRTTAGQKSAFSQQDIEGEALYSLAVDEFPRFIKLLLRFTPFVSTGGRARNLCDLERFPINLHHIRSLRRSSGIIGD